MTKAPRRPVEVNELSAGVAATETGHGIVMKPGW